MMTCLRGCLYDYNSHPAAAATSHGNVTGQYNLWPSTLYNVICAFCVLCELIATADIHDDDDHEHRHPPTHQYLPPLQAVVRSTHSPCKSTDDRSRTRGRLIKVDGRIHLSRCGLKLCWCCCVTDHSANVLLLIRDHKLERNRHKRDRRAKAFFTIIFIQPRACRVGRHFRVISGGWVVVYIYPWIDTTYSRYMARHDLTIDLQCTPPRMIAICVEGIY